VLDQLFWPSGCSTPRQVSRGREGCDPVRSKLSCDQTGIAHLSDPYRDINAFLDQIDIPVAKAEIDCDLWVSLTEGWDERRNQVDADGQRGSHLDEARRFGTSSEGSLLDIFSLTKKAKGSFRGGLDLQA
jgi:hypothetical protein